MDAWDALELVRKIAPTDANLNASVDADPDVSVVATLDVKVVVLNVPAVQDVAHAKILVLDALDVKAAVTTALELAVGNV